MMFKIFKMLIDTPVLIISRKNPLKLPQYLELLHPMCRKTNVVVFWLAGLSQKVMELQSKLKTNRKHRDERQ